MTHSYQEKSSWLKNELECIRKLIEQNPRDPLTANTEEAVEKTTESVPAAPSSSSVTFKDDDNTTRKRKSPETAYSHVDMIQHQQQQDKVSPHQKRTTSFDLEDVLTKLNLPINLDRLTKGQLLSEVEKRGGCGSLSMKSLKKELIDGLKERLLDEYKRSSEAAPSNACQTTRLASNVPTAVSVEEKPVVIEASLSICAPTETQSSSTVAQSQPTPNKGVRKGSLMEEFRHLVNSSNLSGTGSSSIASNSSSGATSTTSSDDKEKVAAEFQARQNRHRDSMARKSQLQMEYSKSSSSSSSSSCSEITQHKAFSDPTTIATTTTAAAVSVDNEQGKASSQNESKSDDDTVSSSTSIGTANGGIWCDVSSPMKTGEEEDVVVVADVTEEGEEKVVIVEAAVDKSIYGGKEQQVVVVETAVSSVKAAVAAIQQKAINEEPKVTSKAHIHTAANNSSNTAAKAPLHKPGGGSTTHNKTAATAKTVVSSQPHHLSTHAPEAQSSSHAAPVKKGLFSGMSMFGSKKTVSPPATVVSTSTITNQSKATAVASIVSPIADHQVSPTNTTTSTTSPTTNDDAAASASMPHVNSEVQSVPVASSIAVAAFDVTAVTSSDAVVQKKLLTTTTTAPTANEGKKKDARLINAIAPSAAAAVTATNTAPTTNTSSSLKLKDAFASKNLITSIVSNYNAALASPTPQLQQSASVPSISMHPVNATTIAATTTTDSLASALSVTSSSLSDTVLSAATTQQQQQVNEPSPSTNDEEEYIIEDR